MIQIIENTLRDGSYILDFQFDALQTTRITARLAAAGFRFIEVGHGLGLGTFRRSEIAPAKETDSKYIESALAAAGTANVGAFFIPGIGEMEDIERAIDAGVHFLRVGVNIDAYKRAEKFVNYCKARGLWVAVNLMKSYAVKAYEFSYIASEVNKWQSADAIYLVDSAGCMLPEEVGEYISRAKEQINTHLGFHGHNNLSMAVANSIQAVRSGASFVDTSIRCMGRSAGNAQTEIVVHILQKLGISPVAADPYTLYSIAQEFIEPAVQTPQGLSAEEIHIGISRFHSSYMPLVEKAVAAYSVDPMRLIKEVSDINCVNPTQELFDDIARQMQAHG